jgi:hypothetical protein
MLSKILAKLHGIFNKNVPDRNWKVGKYYETDYFGGVKKCIAVKKGQYGNYALFSGYTHDCNKGGLYWEPAFKQVE